MVETGKRILLVDDSELVQTMLADHLESEGFEILTARDGQAGFEQVLAQKPDLIITDVQMPRMNGLDLTRKLRETESTRATPIIMITTLNTMEDRIAGIEAGADDFINKPFNKQILLLKIRNLLKSSALARQVAERYHELREATEQLKRLQGERQFSMEVVGDELRNLAENLRGTLERLAAAAPPSSLPEPTGKLLAHAVECGKILSDKLNRAFKGM